MNNTPKILREGRYTTKSLKKFQSDNDILVTKDIYKSQLQELYRINNPNKNPKTVKASKKLKGDWIYFPWNKTMIHMVSEKDYFKLRTNRNKNLITKQEQNKLNKFTVGVVGLSVGSSIALGLVQQGISNSIKLAERDVLDTTNLNRLQVGVSEVGKEKISITSERIYDINPYAKLTVFNKGIDDKNISKFFSSSPKLKFVVDEIDDFKMKIKLRLFARKFKIPLLMMTNLGDSVLIDIERYDLKPKMKMFNNLLGNIPDEILSNKNISPQDEKKYAMQIVGIENIPPRAIESVKEIGKTLVGRPQFGSTVSVSAGLAVMIIRKIALGDKMLSGRYRLDFQEIFK